jgi:hypothetical protein
LGITLSACALVVAACSDSTEPESDPLTLKEATALFVGLRSSPTDANFEPVLVSADSLIVQCPFGGQVKLVGSIDDRPPVNDTARVVSIYEITPTGCGFTSEEFRFAVNGDPNIRDVTILSFIGQPFHLLLEGSTSGALDWELAGRTGTCDMSLTLSGDPGVPGLPATSTARYTGTMCGHEVDFDASWIVRQLLGR